jgi:hypothetical protein
VNYLHKILPNGYKLEFVFSNYINQISSLVYYFLIANNFSKNDFALLAFFQLNSSILRYFNFGTPFFIQNKILTKPRFHLPLILGIHFQFYFVLLVLIVALFFFLNGILSSFHALLLIVYIILENFFMYAELVVRSKSIYKKLIQMKYISSLLTAFFIVLAYLDYLTFELALFRYIVVWLISGFFLSLEFLSIDIFKKAFRHFSNNSNLLLLLIKSSIPYGIIIYLQELFLVFPRLLVTFINVQLIGELSFGLTVVSNFNLAIASILQIDYNNLYQFFSNNNIKYFFSESRKFILKYFIIYLIFLIVLIFIVPSIFNFFHIFENFEHIRVSFFIFISYYLIMVLLTPIQILVNINNSNSKLSILSILFLLLFSLLFFIINNMVCNVLIVIAISFFISLVIYALVVLFYFRRYFYSNRLFISE